MELLSERKQIEDRLVVINQQIEVARRLADIVSVEVPIHFEEH